MKIKFIAPLLLIPFFLGCGATIMLSNNIRMDDSPRHELKRQKYSGTIMYNPDTNIYYTDQLLIGEDRKVAISFSKGCLDCDLRYKIEEIDDFTKIPLKEVPLRIETERIRPEASDLLNNGIVIESRGIGLHDLVIYISTNSKTNSCDYGDFKVRRITKNFITHNLKKLGYLITVPIDIVTGPFQFFYARHMLKE
jgi:hypothetical protein